MNWQSTGLVLVVVLAGACGRDVQESSPAGTLTDSAGVSVWTIPAGDLTADLRVERLRGLSQPDTGWAVWPDGIAVDEGQELIYVLDESTPRVLVFDFQGGFRGVLGRKGQGPGEYDSPTALTMDDNGDLLVMDPGAGAVLRWSRAGAYQGREPMSPGYWGPGFAAMEDALLYTTAGGVETGTMIEALVSVSVSRVDTLTTVESTWKPLVMPCGRMPVPEVFSQSAVWGAGAGRVVIADVPHYGLALRRGGALEAVFRRDVPPRQITPAEAEASLPQGPLSFLVEGCGMTAAGVVRDAGFVEEVSPIFLLTVDPGGRVWAARGLAPAIERIDVFDPARGFLGSIQSAAFPIAFLDGSRYLAIVESEWGSVVEVWQVQE